MKTFTEFCERHGLDHTSQDAKADYECYLINLKLFREAAAESGCGGIDPADAADLIAEATGDDDRVIVLSKNGAPMLIPLKVCVAMKLEGGKRSPFTSAEEMLSAYWVDHMPTLSDITTSESTDKYGLVTLEARSPTGHAISTHDPDQLGATRQEQAAAIARGLIAVIAYYRQ